MKKEDEAASLQTAVSEQLKQLEKKQTFESAASALSTLIQAVIGEIFGHNRLRS